MSGSRHGRRVGLLGSLDLAHRTQMPRMPQMPQRTSGSRGRTLRRRDE